MEGRLNMKNNFKTKIFSMMLVFSIILGQMVGIGGFSVKAAGSNFNINVVVEAYDKVLYQGTSSKTKVLDAIKEVLSNNNAHFEGDSYINVVDGYSASGNNGWSYAVNRNSEYQVSPWSPDFQLENGDKIVFYYGGWPNTLLANKITYSTKNSNEKLDISFEQYYDPNVTPIGNINVKLVNKDKGTTTFEQRITTNKITLPNGLEPGNYVIELSDFGNKIPNVVADSFNFTITAAPQTNTPSDNSNNTPSSPYDRDNTKIVKDVQTDLTNTSNYIKSKSAGDAWSILSMAKLGLKPDLTFINQSAADIKKNKGVADFTNTDLEKLIMVLTAAGYSPYSFMGYNLVSELYNRDIDSFLINDAIYGLMAYNYANITGNYTISKDKLIDLILKNKLAYKKDNTDITGWALSGNAINPDITGLAINALSPYYKDNASVKTAIDVAVDSLSKLQTESGYIADSYGYSSESLDVVILGLTSVGVNPEGDKFKKSKGDLVSAMLSFKGTDGQFKHSIDGKNDFIATEEALRALITLKEFKAKGIYNYYSSSTDSTKLAAFTLGGEEASKTNSVESTKQEMLPQTGSPLDSGILYVLGSIVALTGLFIVIRTKSVIK
ncbi:LPXTG-motif protein cell wall anchor domain protein [Clostridiales bacterium oral taxon 876 str. F0540]|nr:LPXTG-motif protein cell wall anchor domain protein [Clostridiales bacterium oral taxon 876 str. F0540]